jgi:SAM-dependent methyltransferase
MEYDSINAEVLVHIPPGSRRILDIGCGVGSLGQKIKTMVDGEVVGVTFDQREADLAKSKIDKVILRDLNCWRLDDNGTFDCIICCHVLEHLNQPEILLANLHSILEPTGVLVVALPNILFWKQRLEFIRGRFRYTDGGLMDRTHYRFYDWEGAKELLEKSGFGIDLCYADGALPLSRLLWHKAASRLNKVALKQFPGLFGWQFIFKCRSVGKVSQTRYIAVDSNFGAV